MNPKMPLRGSNGKPASRNSLAHCLRAKREFGAPRAALALEKKRATLLRLSYE